MAAELEFEELIHCTFDKLARSESHRVRAAQAALAFYSADGYLGINSAFRRVYADPPTIREDRLRVATFMYAIEPVVIESPFSFTAYRGVGRTEGGRLFEALERGERMFEYSFPLSVSYDERVAERFLNRFETVRGEREIMLYLLVPPGTRLVLVEPFSTYPNENEILILPRVRLVMEKVVENSYLKTIRILATVAQEPLPAPSLDVDESLIWHWQLCSGVGVDTDIETDTELEHTELQELCGE